MGIFYPEENDNPPVWDESTMVYKESWADTFDAALGGVIDEDLSASALFREDGFEKRNQALRDSDIDYRDYSDAYGNVDWDRVRDDTGDARFKRSGELQKEEEKFYADKRAYREGVFANGAGSAQFLGAMTGYMLDPVNVLTMPLAAPVATLRAAHGATQVIKALGKVALTEGAIGVGVESAIQIPVSQFKDDIGVDYGVKDALFAIGTAAVGQSILGTAFAGAARGIQGRLAQTTGNKVGLNAVLVKLRDDLPDTPEGKALKEQLSTQIDTLNNNPTRKIDRKKVGKLVDEVMTKTGKELDELEATIKGDSMGDRMMRSAIQAKRDLDDFVDELAEDGLPEDELMEAMEMAAIEFDKDLLQELETKIQEWEFKQPEVKPEGPEVKNPLESDEFVDQVTSGSLDEIPGIETFRKTFDEEQRHLDMIDEAISCNKGVEVE